MSHESFAELKSNNNNQDNPTVNTTNNPIDTNSTDLLNAATKQLSHHNELSNNNHTNDEPKLTFNDVLYHPSNADILIKLYRWSVALFVIPMVIFYATYIFIIDYLQHDKDTALTYGGILAAIFVMLISILFGIYAYYDDNDNNTNKNSGVNWFNRNDELDKQNKKEK